MNNLISQQIASGKNNQSPVRRTLSSSEVHGQLISNVSDHQRMNNSSEVQKLDPKELFHLRNALRAVMHGPLLRIKTQRN